MKKITCLNCSKKFIHYNKTQPSKYCSKKCFREKRNERKRLKRLANVKNIKINCKFCKKKFSKKSNSQKLHCSKRCVYKSQLKRDRERKKKLLKTSKKFREHYYKVQKEWRDKNPEKTKQYFRKTSSRPEYKKRRKEYLHEYMSNPEKRKKRREWEKEWGKKDYVRKKKKEYKLKNKKHIKKWNKEYVQRPEVKKRISKIRKNRYKNDPVYLIQNRIRTRFYTYIRRGLAEKKVKTNELIGCSWKQLKIHIEKQFKPNMKWSNYGKWHIDHIKPMSKFNLMKIEDQYKCCNYKNLQPLWAEENLSKGDRMN